jgi:DNA primase
MTNSHGEILRRLAKAYVIVAFDGDKAGMKATEATYEAVRGKLPSPFAAALPPGSDPAQSLVDVGSEGLLRRITRLRPLAEALVDRRIAAWSNLEENAEARVACLRHVARVLSSMSPQDVAREARRLPGILGLDHATVTRELADAVSNPMPTSEHTRGLHASCRAVARSGP